MNISLSFIRLLFIALSILFFTAYTSMAGGESLSLVNLLRGAAAGIGFSLLLIGCDYYLQRYPLRSFNTALLGLFIGYLMGQALIAIFQTFLEIASISAPIETLKMLKIALLLTTAYLGMGMTVRASEELHVSIPFVKFKPISERKKDIILDHSILSDTRIIELASSGLVDNHLILPRFILKELYELAEHADEHIKGRARRSLDIVKKLEGIPTLGLRIVETDFPEVKESMQKLVSLARLLDAHVITVDISKVQESSIEGVRIINLNTLSNAIKPVSHSGEFLHIKIQRYGKEARQGVGYLEDGTMVVVNGGAEYIGETIRTQVLSVKHTTSGRMIFCNAMEHEGIDEMELAAAGGEISNKSYFAL